MATKPNPAKIVLANQLGMDLIDESIRVLGRFIGDNKIVLEDRKTILQINTSLIHNNKQKKLNIGGLYYFIGEYRNGNLLMLRIVHELDQNEFNIDRYLKCVNILHKSHIN